MTNTQAETIQRRFRVGDLVVDLERQSVMRRNERLDLPDLSFRLFAALISRAPDSVTKDDLIREVWGDVVVGDETLSQRVRLLRQALDEDSQNPRYLSSVRGHGYRLVCPVSVTGADRTARLFTGTRLALLAAVVIAGFFVGSKFVFTPSTGDSNSIAVLPFADLSPDRDYGYFADGMQEELLTRLTRLENLDVVSRTSVEVYRTTELDLQEIADQVDVRSIIEGSVRIADDRVRVTVQLIDAETDRHLWAENFDRELSVENIILIQEEIADQIARALELEYQTQTQTQAGQIDLPTSSLDAYNAYLLGRYHTFRQTPGDLRQAVAYLHEATTLDPEFAGAFAALGWAYSFLGTPYGGQPPKDVYPQAKQAAMRALALNSNLADARTIYADILTWYDWDFATAELEYRKTIELDPLNTLGYALFLSSQLRHDEAIAVLADRLAAAPDDPYVRVNAAWRYLNAGRYDQAIEEAMLAQDHTDARSVLGWSFLASGDIERGVEALEQDLLVQGRNPQQLSNLAFAYFKAGRNAEGERLLAELQAEADSHFVSPVLIAAVHFAAGDADRGFALLEEGVRDRDRGVVFVQVSQMLNGYRKDPRYDEIVRRIGFTPSGI